jgi:hypothetical protein
MPLMLDMTSSTTRPLLTEVTSHEQIVNFDTNIEVDELISSLAELKSPLHLPPINLDEAYDFASLLFTPEHSHNQATKLPVHI